MKTVELLSPAGSVEQLIASIENGADAVYVGGRFLNARNAAENFSDEDMEKAVIYAHLRGAKVYVTMNTLVRDDELEEGLKYAAFLYGIGVDALIIQDLGLGKYIHDNIPDFPLHLSTQASVYGPGGVRFASRLGYERTVLARECTREDIKKACAAGAECGEEIEVFCHGALCVCYSGECQLSRYNGGRSGNRGSCAQPCRLRYLTQTEEGAALTEGVSDYPLSPKDLSLIDRLGDLIDMGVSSLKIEGRMKSPEYAAVVTGIYRKYIDEYLENGFYRVSDEDREALEQIYSRGHTEGYYSHRKGQELMTSDIPKHRGIKIGYVVARRDNELIDIYLSGKLEMGDGIEVHSKDLTGNIVTYIKERNRDQKGALVTIGDIRGKVSGKDPVYRTSSKAQLTEARRSYQGVTLEGEKGSRKLPVDMRMEISGEGLLLQAETPDGIKAECWSDVPGDIKKGASDDRFIKALSKTGSTTFEARDIEISDEVKELAMKVSEINKLRRTVLGKLRDSVIASCSREIVLPEREGTIEEPVSPEPAEDKFWGEGENKSGLTLELYFDTWADFAGFGVTDDVRSLLSAKGARIKAVLPLADVIRNVRKLARVSFIPYISSITRGKEDAFLRANFEAVKAICAQTGVYVGTMEWIAPLMNEGITIFADYGLNIYNEETRKLYEEIGIDDHMPSLEKLDSSSGNYPLMVLEHEPLGAFITDDSGRMLSIKRRDFSSQAIIKPGKSSAMEAIKKTLEKAQEGTARVYI